MNKSEAIKSFLALHTHNDLSSMYNINMECQVNVAQDNGERVKGEYKGKAWSGWTDTMGNLWKSFRIPYGANTEPTYTDTLMKFDLDEHAEGIGMTGWDWFNRLSRWVAFDFDSIVGHSDKHSSKLTVDELNRVREAATQLPWATLRRSTSGKGLHIYVFLDPVKTINHTEHAALARAILNLMSAKTGFPFNTHVDICGGNMWVWHRKMTDTDGLKIIKHGDVLDHVPPNWRDHLQVVSGKRRRVLPEFSNEAVDDLSSQKQHIALDTEHRDLIEFLDKSGASFWWDNDHHMLVAHTYDLARAYEELNLRGLFTTIAKGSEHGTDHNCFLYPLRRGAWVVRRYGQGATETDTWELDGKGFTKCFLNQMPDLRTACKAHEGVEHPTGGFIFKRAEDAGKAAQILGVDFKVPNQLLSRSTKLKKHKDGRIVVEIHRDSGDTVDKMHDWCLDKSNKYVKIFDAKLEEADIIDVGNYDDIVRHIVSEGNQSLGWAIKSEKQWTDEPLTHVNISLRSMGLKPDEIQTVVGNNIFKPWQILNKPFESEYIGDRCWNRKAAQFRYPPNLDKDVYHCPTWDKILQHVGSNLDRPIREDKWCKENGLLMGSDYLRCWIASLFQKPYEQLPYLFLWGDQNTGKSILHEALGILMTSGYVRADMALQTHFNGELQGAVVCVVEETDLQNNKKAYNAIKDYVTSLQINIHIKGSTPIMLPNTTHWIQCANEPTACPLFQGDTRVTVINVPQLEHMTPKRELMEALQKEASDFLASVLKLELPRSEDRLNVPVIDTKEKRVIARSNQNMLELFISECCFETPGQKVRISDFHMEFLSWLDPGERYQWSKPKVSKMMHPRFPKGRDPQNSQWCYGNITFDKNLQPLIPYTLNERGDTLVPKTNTNQG